MYWCDSRKSYLFTSETFIKRRRDKYSMNDSFPSLCAAFLLIKKQGDASSWAPLPYGFSVSSPSPCACSARLPLSQLRSMLSPTVSMVLLGGGSHDAWVSMKEKGLQLRSTPCAGCVFPGGKRVGRRWQKQAFKPLGFTPRLQILNSGAVLPPPALTPLGIFGV